MTDSDRVDSRGFLGFVECAGCGEMFSVHKKLGMNRAKWCSERCRKRQYDRSCIDCGGRIGGTTPGRATGRCFACYTAHRTYWTTTRIVEAIQAFAAIHGRAPTASEWNVSGGSTYPSVHTVQRVLGSWNAGLEAAGFDARGPGEQITYAARRQEAAA